LLSGRHFAGQCHHTDYQREQSKVKFAMQGTSLNTAISFFAGYLLG